MKESLLNDVNIPHDKISIITVMAAGITVPPSTVHGSAIVIHPEEICSGNGINTARTVQNNGKNECEIEMEFEDLAGSFKSAGNQPDRPGIPPRSIPEPLDG
jgi:hypothetical protein